MHALDHFYPPPPQVWPTDFILGHKARLRGVMQAITGNEADELLQDLWVRSTRQMVPNDPEHYLTRAAKHLAIERFRSNQRRSSKLRPLPDDLADDTTPDCFETREYLLFLLGRLPSDQRLIVERYYFDGMTREAIAEEMGIARATAYRKLDRSIATMRTISMREIA